MDVICAHSDVEVNGEWAAPGVLVVDEHTLFAEALVLTLLARGLAAAQEPAAGPDLAERVMNRHPDLVLLDLGVGRGTGVLATTLGRLTSSGLRVLIITGVADRRVHLRCLKLGATAVLGKESSFDSLVAAIKAVVDPGGLLAWNGAAAGADAVNVSGRFGSTTQGPGLLARLTPRERGVLAALMDGHAAGRIARDQQLSLLTVRTHIRSVLHKLDVHSQLEAVSLSRREGWIIAEEPAHG